MNNKNKYIQEVKNELAEWQGDIYKLKVVAEDAGWEDPDRQIRYYQIIEDIVSQKQELSERLFSIEDPDKTDWHASKAEIDTLRKEVAEAIAAARSSVT